MPIRADDAPLIVTAHLDEVSFQVLDDLRRRHFPSRLNEIAAHVSLFHHLPGGASAEVVRDVEVVCRDRASFVLRFDGIRSLGRGTAIAYEAIELHALRAELAARWSAWLTPQDRQPFRPHVTVQNKVSPAEARTLREGLRDHALPDCVVEGIRIWRYLDGPWDAVDLCRFARSSGLSRA